MRTRERELTDRLISTLEELAAAKQRIAYLEGLLEGMEKPRPQPLVAPVVIREREPARQPWPWQTPYPYVTWSGDTAMSSSCSGINNGGSLLRLTAGASA